MQGSVFFLQQNFYRTIIFFCINAKDRLFLQSSYAGDKALSIHGEGCKIRIRKTMSVCVMLFDIQITFVVEYAMVRMAEILNRMSLIKFINTKRPQQNIWSKPLITMQ